MAWFLHRKKHTKDFEEYLPKQQMPMNNQTKLLMKYLYHREWKEKYVTLSEIWQSTQTGKYQKRVDAARGIDTILTRTGVEAGPGVAEELPFVLPAVGLVMTGEDHAKTQQSKHPSYTGLVLLSFRSDKGQEVLEQLRRKVNLWEQTILSFLGSSGQSLKVLLPYRLVGGKLPSEPSQVMLFQQYAYKRAAEYALASTGLRPEEVIHDGSEGFRLSADSGAYLNLQARPIEMEQPTKPLTDETAAVVEVPAEIALDAEVLPGYTRREMDAVKFNFICRKLAYSKELGLEGYLMRLATECRKAGIDQELAAKQAVEMAVFYQKEVLVRTTFNTAYEKHPLGCANPVERSLLNQQLLEAFLRRRYMFRRNQVTGEVEYQEKYHYNLWWKPLTEEARNDMNNAAILEGIKVWPKDLDRVLISERIEKYDPVQEWLRSLPRWDGRDRLGELADRVKTPTPGWRDNFKVWMRSMVNQWRAGSNLMYGAQMVLMLVGGQGTRKSTFMRMLLPRELMPFYIDRIDFTNKKEALRALSRFLLINIDEYDQISKAQTAFLKHLIQRTDVKERKLYSTIFEQSQRYAAFCATTNSLLPLKDESGSRRYMVVEVSDVIDTDTMGENVIDYPQLYSQIVYEIETGEDYAFTGERERQIVAQNADYYEVPNVIALFEDRFRRPLSGDQILMLSPTEILQELKLDFKNRSYTTLLGSYLHRNGFERGKGEQRRRYVVGIPPQRTKPDVS